MSFPDQAPAAAPVPSPSSAAAPSSAPAPALIRLPNARAGEPYAYDFTLADCPAGSLVLGQCALPAALGLVADHAAARLSGTPAVAGEYAFEAQVQRADGMPDQDGNLGRLLRVQLLVNPDPRTLWKNQPSDRQAMYWRADEDCASLRGKQMRVLAASKRGRSHAHVGSFRDDDVRIALVAESGWAVAVVADGAGSVKYAREGAHLICTVARERLTAALGGAAGKAIDVAAQAYDDARRAGTRGNAGMNAELDASADLEASACIDVQPGADARSGGDTHPGADAQPGADTHAGADAGTGADTGAAAGAAASANAELDARAPARAAADASAAAASAGAAPAVGPGAGPGTDAGEAAATAYAHLHAALVAAVGSAAYYAAKAIMDECDRLAPGLQASFKDYSSTAQIAVCKRYPFGTLCAAYWVGDGAVAIYDKRAGVTLLGQVDSGEYAGQTRFLEAAEVTQEALQRRTRVALVDDFTALFLMTDGVSDPWFETDARLARSDGWDALWNKLEAEVGLADDAEGQEKKLLAWLDFWSQGNHDDRTIAIIL